MSDRWLTFLYQYGIGATIYLLSIVVLLRVGAIGQDARSRRRWVALLVVGLLVYAVGQGALQFLAPAYDLNLGGAP